MAVQVMRLEELPRSTGFGDSVLCLLHWSKTFKVNMYTIQVS